jgi:hypothetical protein
MTEASRQHSTVRIEEKIQRLRREADDLERLLEDLKKIELSERADEALWKLACGGFH